MTLTDDSLNPIDRLAEEFVDRYRRGQRPTWQEYAERHPELADEIRELFPTLVIMEQLRPNSCDTLDGPGDQQQTGRETIPQFGDFHVLQEVGRGGMGIVYEAEQVSLGRRVALKVLPKHLLQDKRHKKRFEREARAAARLHHTNIVPVFGVGEQNGLLYYVMQFIQGLPLDQVLVELRRKLKSPGADARSDRLREPLAVSLAQIDQPVAEAIVQEGGRRVELSAARVAESLLSGAFRQPNMKSEHESEANVPITRTMENSPAGEGVGDPGDTASCRLSETQVGSQAVQLRKFQPGPSSAHVGPTAFWQSIARIGEQVAEALQHAHDQGVIHRDIKPGNLLLDIHGTVWVTDFGLAKADDQQNLTQTGDVLGTLRYMAPEQFQGHGDAQSDVYALGITLYELLALRPAFANTNRGELIHQILHESVTPLRSVDPTIPRDLATIVHKAIERDPRHRYATAKAMADDLHRFVTDEPILARHLSPSARLRRWCRKNPAVAGLTGALATLLTCVAVGSSLAAARFEKLATANAQLVVQANQEKSQAQAAKEIALVAQRQAESAAEREKRLREEAERQKDRANSNFTRARRAVDTYLSHVTDNELLSVPGLQTLRHDLLTAALRFYTEFSEESSDDPQIAIELASGRFRLSRIQSELGLPETTETLRKAIPMLESLHEQRIGGNETTAMLAEAYYYAQRYDEAIATCNTILESDPKSVTARSTLADTYNALALSDGIKTDPAKVLELHQQALALRQQLVAEYPDAPEHNASLSSTFHNIGVLLSRQGKKHDALKMFELGLQYNEHACRMVPRSILWGRWLTISHNNIGSLQRSLGDQQAALAAYRAATEEWHRLVLQNPALTSLKNDYYQALQTLASQQRRMSQTVDASRTMRDAREVLEEMRLRIDTPQQWFELATVYASLAFPGETEAAAEGLDPESQDEQQRNVERTLAALQQAVDAGWVDTKAIETHAAFAPLLENEAFQELVRITIPLKQPELAAEAGSQIGPDKLADQLRAAEILSQRIAAAPEQADHRRSLAVTQYSIGTIQTTLKQYDAAEQSLQRAIELMTTIKEVDSEGLELAVELLSSRIALARVWWDKGDFPRAHRSWQQCLLDGDALARAHRTNHSLQRSLGLLERHIAGVYAKIGLFDYVQAFAQRAVDFDRLEVGARRNDGRVTYSQFSQSLLRPQTHDIGSRYLITLGVALMSQADPPLEDVAHTIRGLLVIGENSLDIRQLIDRVIKLDPETARQRVEGMAVALALVSLGEHERALQVLHNLVPDPSLGVKYLELAIQWNLGQTEIAERNWHVAEAEYIRMQRTMMVQDPNSLWGFYPEGSGNIHFAQALRRFAMETMADGQPVRDDPWQHLIQARGYHLIGETDLADKELAAAAASGDAEIWLARARLLEQWGVSDRAAERMFERVVETSPNDPLPWIHRGRLHVERGAHEQAEADFAHAASLTPNELNKFLEAGWWVVGPYSDNLDEFAPPEFDPDPSRPVHVLDSQTGFSEKPYPWLPVATGAKGAVDLPAIREHVGNGSVYMMAIVYSPDERTELLRVTNAKGIRVWCNEDLVARFDTDFGPNMRTLRAPIVLRAGINRILVRTKTASKPAINLGDSASLQVYGLAEQGFYQRAAAIQNTRGVWSELDLGSEDHAPMLWLALLTGDEQTLIPKWDGLFRLATDSTDFWRQHRAAMTSLLTDEPMVRQRAGEVMTALRVHVPHFEQNFPMKSYGLRILPLYAAMQGDMAEANNYLQWWFQGISGELAPQRAFIELELGKRAEAAEELDAGLAFWEKKERYNWYLRVWYLALLRRVELQINGTTERTDAIVARIADKATALAESRDPQTAAFDQLVDTYGCISTEQWPAYPFVMRGRRLAELGRVDQAAIDFNKALELAPRDQTVAAEQARFLVRRGDVERGSAAYAQAYGMPADHPVGMLAEELERGRTQQVWNFALGDKTWSYHEQVEIAASAGVLSLRTTGTDPQVLFDTWAPQGKKWLTICARTPQPIETFELYWSTLKSPNLSTDKVTRFSVNASDGKFRRYHVIFEPDSELRSLRLDPGWNADVTLEIAWVTLRDYSAAEFNRIAESDAATPLDLSVMWYQAGQPADAKDALASFEGQASDSSTAWLIASDLWCSLGEFERATAACQRALSLGITQQKQLADARFRLARLKMLADEYPEAIRILTEVIELTQQAGMGRDTIWPERARCVAWLLSGELDQYRQRCTELLEERKPDDDHFGLATIVSCCSLHPQAVDDWSRVIAVAERMVARYAADDWSHVHLFLTLCQAGQVEEAYRRVPDIESKANSWRWVIAIGELLRGNHERATEVLDAFEQQCNTALGFDRAISQSVIEYVRTLIAQSKTR